MNIYNFLLKIENKINSKNFIERFSSKTINEGIIESIKENDEETFTKLIQNELNIKNELNLKDEDLHKIKNENIIKFLLSSNKIDNYKKLRLALLNNKIELARSYLRYDLDIKLVMDIFIECENFELFKLFHVFMYYSSSFYKDYDFLLYIEEKFKQKQISDDIFKKIFKSMQFEVKIKFVNNFNEYNYLINDSELKVSILETLKYYLLLFLDNIYIFNKCLEINSDLISNLNNNNNFKNLFKQIYIKSIKNCCIEIFKKSSEILNYDHSLNYNQSIRNSCKYGSLDIVKYLLKDDRVQPTGFSLMNASEFGHIDIVKELLKDPRIDISYKKYYSILKAKTSEIEELLIKYLSKKYYLREFFNEEIEKIILNGF